MYKSDYFGRVKIVVLSLLLFKLKISIIVFMVITYHSGSFFKVSFGDTTLAFNPISKKSKLKQSRFGADIALITTQHEDCNGIENVTHGGKEPFVISGAGEYEVKNVTVLGFGTDTEYGGAKINTLYIVTLEGMRLCFLGTLNTDVLPPEALAVLDGIDILFTPVGGEGTLDPSRAHELAVKIGASLVIPMLYDDTRLKSFLKEEGSEGVKPVEKLTVKKRDLDGKEGEIVVFKS